MTCLLNSRPKVCGWSVFGRTAFPKRVMKLEELAQVAAFVASDRAGGMTGTTVNLTMGALDD